MSDEVKHEVPEEIHPTEADVDAMSTRAMMKECWARFEGLSVQKSVAKSGNFMLFLTSAPLDAEGEVSKPTTTLRVMPPIANPAVKDHTAPNTKKACYILARALDPNFPQYPRKEGNTYVDAKTSEAFSDVKAKNAAFKEVDRAVAKISSKWWNDPSTLEGEIFYALNVVKTEKYNNQEQTKSEINGMTVRATPPDEPVETSNFKHS